MKIISGIKFTISWAAFAITLTVFQFGCGKEEVRVQKAPKESASTNPAAAPGMNAPGAMAGALPIRWKLPEGWEEQPPDSMRLGNFIIKGPNGAQAQTTIIPLAGLAGKDLDNVNRWRGQVGLPPISEEEMKSQAQKVSIGSTEASLFEMAGTPPDKSGTTRILASFLRQGDTAWFFKMTGEDALVQASKPAFVDFLKTIEFVPADANPQAGMPVAGTPPMSTPGQAAPSLPAASADSGPKPNWTVPSNWQELAPGPMQKAKFHASSQPAEKVEASVVSLGGPGGGLLGNINRWRGQIGLGPIAEAEAASLTTPTNWNGSPFTIINSENPANKMAVCAVITTQKDETWFFKLSGEAPAVAREKESFLKFVQSWKPGAP